MGVPRDPEELTATDEPVRALLPAGTRLGPVRLTVASLATSSDYYERAIGLAVLERDAARAVLGAAGGVPLLVLDEEQGARPADGYTGLFHFALLVPERGDLARWIAHAAATRVPLTGASDHFVSEALYLRDPDHHGIEIYWDRPRELWEGQVHRMGTWPLDVEGVLAELGDGSPVPFTGLPVGTVMGHVHLRVREIASTVAFYRDVVGFGLMAQLGDQAAFLSAGGYHHHIGGNTWESRGAPPAPAGTARLGSATIVLPTAHDLGRLVARIADAGGEPAESGGGVVVRDPSGSALLLTAAV